MRLARFTASGGRVFLMHGNRDFLLDVPIPGKEDLTPFSARCGATLLPDPSVIEVAGRRVGLSHGDALCTDDIRYQQWRALVPLPALAAAVPGAAGGRAAGTGPEPAKAEHPGPGSDGNSFGRQPAGGGCPDVAISTPTC